MAETAAPLFKEYGAIRMVECWGNDVPDGKVTDFKRAVKAKSGERFEPDSCAGCRITRWRCAPRCPA